MPQKHTTTRNKQPAKSESFQSTFRGLFMHITVRENVSLVGIGLYSVGDRF